MFFKYFSFNKKEVYNCFIFSFSFYNYICEDIFSKFRSISINNGISV